MIFLRCFLKYTGIGAEEVEIASEGVRSYQDLIGGSVQTGEGSPADAAGYVRAEELACQE